MKEMHLYGSPGCGKTTRLATEEISNAVKLFTGKKILVMSYTRAGAKEIATKKSLITGLPINIPKENVGTLHKICFWALRSPQIAEAHVAEFNALWPNMSISGSSINTVDDFGIHDSVGKNDGDSLLNRINIYRGKLVPFKDWSKEGRLQLFWKRWCEFKTDHGYLDFTDLIETAIDNYPYAPGRPDVIFVDEAQDMTPLQLKLVRQWGMQTRYFVLCGDDDQTLYSWLGCSPDAFLKSNYGVVEKRILDKSYRVPRGIYDKAMEIITKVKIREPKKYSPRDYDGVIRKNLIGTYRIVDNIVKDITVQTERGRTTMVLATCGYMLVPLIRALKKNGIPFHNQYKNRTDWNPLRKGEKIVTANDFLINFITDNGTDNHWSVYQLLKWANFIKVGDSGLIRKAGKTGLATLKKAIKENADGLETTKNCLCQILTEAGAEQALSRNLEWLLDNVETKRKRSLEYPLKVYKKYGIDALVNTPRCTVGTVHSVKGGESQCVYIFPDLSLKAIREQDRTHDKDPLYRLFYVAVTRASEELVLMKNETRWQAGLW
jgi:superfamily I DNA/RNA helicase